MVSKPKEATNVSRSTPAARYTAAISGCILVVLVGCVQPTGEAPLAEEPTSASGHGANATTPPPQTPPPPAATPETPPRLSAFILDQCAAWTGGLYIHKDLHPALVPDEWRLNNTFGLADIIYWVWDCHRFGGGELERPLRLVLEMHGRATPPELCTDPDDEYWWLIQRVWTDDAAAATYLQATMTLPIEVAPITIQRETRGFTQATASWGKPDAISTLSWQWVEEPSDPAWFQWGFYWFTDGGVAHGVFGGRIETPHVRGPAVTGTVAPGLLYHAALGSHFAGIGDAGTEDRYDVSVTYYEDLLCERPL